jgi:outer membrane protein assembly factor BamC
MQARNTVAGLVVAVVVLTGCSSFTEREVDYKTGAVKAAPLEVPPTLTAPETDQRYTIPGKDGEKVASYSEYNKQKAEQPCVNPVSAPAAVPPAPVPAAPSAQLLESDGSKKIVLGEPFDRGWRRVGLALDNAKLVTSDKDRSKGIFFVVPAPDKDKKKLPDYQILVKENGGTCEVTASDSQGKSDAEATRLIELVYQNLDKNDRGAERHPPSRGDAVRRSR